jgi:hypothetical protein
VKSHHARRIGTAYLLLVTLGWFGQHRQYLGYAQSGRTMMWITLVSLPLLFVGGLGLYGLYIVFFWMVFDLFALPFMTRPLGPRDLEG